MKTIGLIGGMSWESSLEYYKIINETVKNRLGGLYSAKCIMHSFNFQEIEELQHKGDWEELTKRMIEAAKGLKKAGAEVILICTNTMHKMANEVEEGVGLPLLHIADATAEVIKQRRIKKVALLGTKFTMEKDFYKKRLKDKHQIEVIVPQEDSKDIVHNVIYDELCCGIVKESSKEKFKNIIRELANQGAEGVILGCTEIPLLIKDSDVEIDVFNTTEIHAIAAVDYVLE